MPKMKTKRGVVKRFKKMAGGLKRRRANRNHILTKKSTKRKRNLRRNTLVVKADQKSIESML